MWITDPDFDFLGTGTHFGSRVQGSKRQRIPDPGSGFETLGKYILYVNGTAIGTSLTFLNLESQLVSDFIDASRNVNLDFLRKKKLKIVKTISAHSKSTVRIFRTLKKIFIS
jgi:hypothetical protein